MNLVPTASTTAALALGDALAMTLLVRKGFREEQFASLHPGGKLGRRLMRVEHVMHAGDAAPIVRVGDRRCPTSFHEMSSKRLGMTCVVDDDGRLAGVFTDGDLRRLMSRAANVLALTAGDVMTPNPLTIRRELLAVEALRDHGDAQDHVGRRRRRPAHRRRRRPPARSVAHADDLSARMTVVTHRAAHRSSVLLLFDVDGVLTDGAVIMHADGTESKGFHIRDGAAHRLGAARRADGRPAVGARVRTRRRSAPRSSAIRIVVQGVAEQAGARTSSILRDTALDRRCRWRYMGDDLLDLPVLRARRVLGGAGRCRARGAASASHWVSAARGRPRRGPRVHRAGAPRAGQRWDAVVRDYLPTV